MASPTSGSDNQNQAKFDVPEGWVFVSKTNKKGKIVKYYTNICGQTFYNESDLMRYIRYSTENGLSIYDPDFEPPATGPFAMPSRAKVDMRSTSDGKHVPEHSGRHQGSTSKDKEPTLRKDEEVESHHEAECSSARLEEDLNEDEVECVEALLEISLQNESPEDVEVERRASRRLSGHQPELQLDFDCTRALEYIIRGGKQ